MDLKLGETPCRRRIGSSCHKKPRFEDFPREVRGKTVVIRSSLDPIAVNAILEPIAVRDLSGGTSATRKTTIFDD